MTWNCYHYCALLTAALSGKQYKQVRVRDQQGLQTLTIFLRSTKISMEK